MLIYIQQNGSKGKSIPYPSKAHPNATIATSGCGVCSSLMVLLNSTSYVRTLESWTKRVIKCGGRVAEGTDMHRVASAMAKHYGFEVEETNDIAKLKKHLMSGYKAVLHVGNKGYFSSSGHFVCGAGYTKDGKVIVLDPYYYEGKYKQTVNGIDRSKYFTYNKETHELYCSLQTVQRDRRGSYYLFKPTKKIDLKYAADDVNAFIKFGVDISEHNGLVRFKPMKKDVDFVILRLGWVGNYNKDKKEYNHELDVKFNYNYKWAKKRGIPIGVYVYMYTKSEEAARYGAKWTAEMLKGKSLDIPYIFCDMEDKTIAGLGKDKLTAITDAFNSELKSLKHKGGVYASLDWLRNKLDTDKLKKKYPIWIAHYTSGTNKYYGTYDMWQNSSQGRVSGVSGNVDTNYMYKDLII